MNRTHGIVGVARWAVLVAAVVTSAGCGNECVADVIECNGDVLEQCEGGTEGDAHLILRTCKPGACISSNEGRAFCALDKTPDPRCSVASDTRCVGTTLLTCHLGYAVASYDCASAPPAGVTLAQPLPLTPGSGACASVRSVPWCVDESQRDPGCSIQGPSRRCSGNDLIECEDGYTVERTPCGATFCHEPEPGIAACFGTELPDPACAPAFRSSFCVGDTQGSVNSSVPKPGWSPW